MRKPSCYCDHPGSLGMNHDIPANRYGCFKKFKTTRGHWEGCQHFLIFPNNVFKRLFPQGCRKSSLCRIQNSYLSSCHFALVLQLDQEERSNWPAQAFTRKDERTHRFFRPCYVVKGFNSVANDKILDLSKLKTFAEKKIKVATKLKVGYGRLENIVRKCWLPAFSPFSKMFSKFPLFF